MRHLIQVNAALLHDDSEHAAVQYELEPDRNHETIGMAFGTVMTRLGLPRELLIAAHAVDHIAESTRVVRISDRTNNAERDFINAARELVKAWEEHDAGHGRATDGNR